MFGLYCVQSAYPFNEPLYQILVHRATILLLLLFTLHYWFTLCKLLSSSRQIRLLGLSPQIYDMPVKLKIRPKRGVPIGRNSYNIMQISPPLPSFIILSNVSCNFSCASSGIFISFVCKPSFTSKYRLLPNILDSHIIFNSF